MVKKKKEIERGLPGVAAESSITSTSPQRPLDTEKWWRQQKKNVQSITEFINLGGRRNGVGNKKGKANSKGSDPVL